jgi:tRNA nucleotidyltransferase (CCA-adding enzyme)
MDEELRSKLAPQLWDIMATAIALAEDRGWQLYVVGGVVRDLILARNRHDVGKFTTPDIDLLVDGFDRSGTKLSDRAGVELARLMQEIYPHTKLNLYGKFQTAALKWDKDEGELGGLELDIATARTETYPYPAANPVVESSSIDRDLLRRDFTINALAIGLSSPGRGKLIDLYDGVRDLESKYLRVLHPDSLIDDPTRIYRGVRFAVRLGFEFDPTTLKYIHSAIASGIYHRTLATYEKVPALQTRLRSELKYLLSTKDWNLAIERLNELNALKCIHPNLNWNGSSIDRLDRLQQCEEDRDRLAVLISYPLWLLRLELLLMDLLPSDRIWVVENLQLPPDSGTRLSVIDTLQLASLPDLSIDNIVKLLRPYPVRLLILAATTSDRSIADLIWQYLIVWSKVKPLLSGQDLQAMGYQRGARYREILDRVLTATLSNEISDRSDAIALVNRLYPLN